MNSRVWYLFLGMLVVAVSEANQKPAGEGFRGPTVVAHRGLILDAPENTLASFKACLELGFGFELDVQRTKDGHLMCLHDTTIDRTTDRKGSLTELTRYQTVGLDAGSWFSPRFKNQRIPGICLLYTSPSPRDATLSRMPSSA